jgi:dTDP-4-dehydrorhamnose reductase
LKILVTGAGGMVGRAVRRRCEALGDLVAAFDHQSLDICNADAVARKLDEVQPDSVINCAAWTDVDGCEVDRDRAFAANSRGPENLASASAAVNSTFVTISTDYVFDGTKSGFYTQDDTPHPESVYGDSKLQGERLARAAHPNGTIIVRTGFIFGGGGTNFLSTVVERARRGDQLKAISDSFGTPTYAWDLALRLRELAQLKPPGVFHVVNAGDGVSYQEFAQVALKLAGIEDPHVEGIETDSLARPAKRPRNSRLKCLMSPALGLAPLPFWKDSLKDFVSQSDRAAPSTEVAAKG